MTIVKQAFASFFRVLFGQNLGFDDVILPNTYILRHQHKI